MSTTPESAKDSTSRPSASPSRRRLLLGAVAVLPSVYTLSSGAQTALTSANVLRFTTADDTWYRNKVYTGKMGSDKVDCVNSIQTSCYDALHPTKAASGSVWIHNGQRVVAGNGTTINNLSSTPSDYGLVYVDSKGTIRTLDPNGNTALHPVTDSAWTSIAVSSTSLLG